MNLQAFVTPEHTDRELVDLLFFPTGGGKTEAYFGLSAFAILLLRRGLRKTDFPAGIEIVVTGFLAKNGSPTANGRTVTLPDGRDFFAGSSGTGAPNDGAER